jgi:hypothetical protein
LGAVRFGDAEPRVPLALVIGSNSVDGELKGLLKLARYPIEGALPTLVLELPLGRREVHTVELAGIVTDGVVAAATDVVQDTSDQLAGGGVAPALLG